MLYDVRMYAMLNIIYSVYLDDECSRHGIGCCRWRHHFLDLIRVEKRFLNQMRMMTLSSFHWITLETRTDAGVDYFVQSPHHLDAEKKLHSCCCCCISRRAWIERDDVKFNDKKKNPNRPKSCNSFWGFCCNVVIVAGWWKETHPSFFLVVALRLSLIYFSFV